MLIKGNFMLLKSHSSYPSILSDFVLQENVILMCIEFIQLTLNSASCIKHKNRAMELWNWNLEICTSVPFKY